METTPGVDKNTVKVIRRWIEHLSSVPEDELEEEIEEHFEDNAQLAQSLQKHLQSSVFPRIKKSPNDSSETSSRRPSQRRAKTNQNKGDKDNVPQPSASSQSAQQDTTKKKTRKAEKLDAMNIDELMEYFRSHVIDPTTVHPLTPIKNLVIIGDSNLEETPLDKLQEIAKNHYRLFRTSNMLSIWNSIEMGRILLIAKNKVNAGKTDELRFPDWLKTNGLCSYSHAQKLINLFTALRNYPRFKLCSVSQSELFQNLKKIQEWLADPQNTEAAKFWQAEVVHQSAPESPQAESSSLVDHRSHRHSNKRSKQEEDD